MGLKVNNLVIVSDLNVEKSPTPSALPTQQLSEIRVKHTTGVESIKEPSVVVDGKVKKIGKKSAFLLDMLTLDD